MDLNAILGLASGAVLLSGALLFLGVSGRPATLPEGTSLGKVVINVRDLEAEKKFYKEVLLFEIAEEDSKKAVFSFGGAPFLEIRKTPSLPAQKEGDAGLYHFAAVYSERRDISRVLSSVLSKRPSSYVGSANHSVSEAFYFSDPEGNGIELYYDLPKSEWKIEGDGSYSMETSALDEGRFFSENSPGEARLGSARLRHMHLKVGDVEKAERFYSKTLGFPVKSRRPGAVFLAVGDYHHQIAVNTWESAGAEKRGSTLGLSFFEIILDEAEDFSSLEGRLKREGVPFARQGNSISLKDPWGSEISVVGRPPKG